MRDLLYFFVFIALLVALFDGVTIGGKHHQVRFESDGGVVFE